MFKTESESIEFLSEAQCAVTLMKTPSDMFAVLRMFGSAIGVECVLSNSRTYTYDGEKVNIQLDKVSMDAKYLLFITQFYLHDLFHFQLCSAPRRRMINYGLGVDPGNDFDAKTVERVMFTAFRDDPEMFEYVSFEENVATLLSHSVSKKHFSLWMFKPLLDGVELLVKLGFLFDAERRLPTFKVSGRAENYLTRDWEKLDKKVFSTEALLLAADASVAPSLVYEYTKKYTT